MKLIYKIEYNSTSFYFKRLIDELIKNSNIDANTKQYFGFILIFIDDELENIEKFFLNLETNLPYSMFLKKSYLIDEFNEEIKELEDKNIKENFEILTNRKVKDILENSNFDFLSQIVNLNRSFVVKFQDLELFLPNKNLKENFEKDNYEIRLLVTNSQILTDLFIIEEPEINLLCSIERPLVKLKLKNIDENISSSGYIFTRLVNSSKEVELSKALKEQNIDYILYVTKKDELKACSFENLNLIISDDKTLYPKYDYKKDLIFNSSSEYLNSFSNVYNAVLHEHNLLDKTSIGVYFSLNSKNSFVDIKVLNEEEKRVIYIPDIKSNMNQILEDISSLDENCRRLVDNFSKKYPYTKDIKLSNNSGFSTIIEAIAKLLNIQSIKDFEELALNSGYADALQIDMKLIKIDNKNYLDYRKTIQSIMSYKMADVDNETLSFSFYEFLAEFIIDYLREIARKIDAKDIVLCGDIFSNRQVFHKVYKELNKKYNLILPTEYAMDYI
jgi:hypothetical protein